MCGEAVHAADADVLGEGVEEEGEGDGGGEGEEGVEPRGDGGGRAEGVGKGGVEVRRVGDVVVRVRSWVWRVGNW